MPPTARAVVLDIEMPLMSGLQVAEAIRKLNNGCEQATLLAMSGDPALLAAAEKSGHFQAVLTKPIDVDQLLRLI